MLYFQSSPAYTGQNTTGTVEPSRERNGFWDILRNPGEEEGAAFCPWFFWSLGNVMVESTFSSSVPGLGYGPLLDFWVYVSMEGQPQQSSHFSSEGMTYPERKKDLFVAVVIMSVINCTLQMRVVINWVGLTIMTSNIWREVTKKQS